MDGDLPFYRDPKKQIYVFVLVAAILYLFLLGRQGVARSLQIDGDYAYLTVGKYGGVRIINIQNPANPVQAGYYDSAGNAKGLQKIGTVLFVADGDQGLLILNVADPRRPVVMGSVNTQGDAQAVSVADKYAFVADGDSGVAIVDVSDLAAPVVVGKVDTPGNAQGLVAVSSYSNPTTPAPTVPGVPVEQPQLLSLYVLVADGDQGLQIINALTPISASIVGSLDTRGDARDVILYGPFALVADGKGGLWVVNVSNPIGPSKVSEFAAPGEATSLAISNNLVYLAEGSKGLSVVNLSDPTDPKEAMSFNTSGNTSGVTVLGNLVYLASGDQGMKVINTSNPNAIHQLGAYETPGEASFGQILSSMLKVATGRFAEIQGKLWRTLLLIIFDIVLLFIVLYFWLGFFAQFTLPVHRLDQRRQAIDRLVNYHLGNKGPAIFIENGEFRPREKEEYRVGPGVALLDSASAAVFRNEHAFTRPAGPGVVFTDIREFPAGTVDLHRQSKSLGPNEKEDPFAQKSEDETPEEFRDRQERRYATSGLTRDGVEVVPNISTSFILNSTPGEGRTQFGYNPQSVWLAIAGEGINPQALPETNERYVPWNYLPCRLAVDVWRELLLKFTLDQLFNFADFKDPEKRNSHQKTAFDTIQELVRARLQDHEVMELDEFGTPTKRLVPSKEYDILKKRGIKVESVNIRRLRFPQKVEENLVNQWIATWLQRAEEELQDAQKIQEKERTQGQETALKGYSLSVSQLLYEVLKETKSPDLPESLELLTEGALKLCLRDEELQSRLTNQKADLSNLMNWIRKS